MNIFQRKSIDSLLSETREEGEHTLKKSLGAYRLIALGMGAIIGAGLFSITGLAAGNHAGPSITLSFLVAAAGCGFAGLCYAEFASMIPIAGSAYTYSYATLGEFIAWVIGWDLVLEYAVSSATVSISWSGYFIKLLEGFQIHLPVELTACPWEGGWANLPAAFIVILMSLLLIRGTESSSKVNSVIVFLKVAVVIVFIVLGWKYIRSANYVPYIPENTGNWGEFGFSGIIRGAAIVFFAFLGFDAVSTAAQETKNPKKNMPIGILGSLIICTILYVLFAHVLTGVANYKAFHGREGIAPVALAINQMGAVLPDGSIQPAFPWLNKAIIVAILAGFSSVILVMLLGQSRIFYSMSRDGLLPKVFSEVHHKYRSTHKSNLLFLVLVGAFAMFVPVRVAGELVSIGTLLAFIIVSIGIIVLRRTQPNAPRAFKTPGVPFIPALGIFICFFMMVFLPFDTWIRLILWMLVGHNIYVFYGSRRSRLGAKKGVKLLSIIGCGIAVILLAFTVAHQSILGWKNISSFTIFLLLFSLFHLAMYGIRWARKK